MDNNQKQGRGMGGERVALRMVRDPDGRQGWARWRVFAGRQLVGFVAEDREWLGDDFGAATYLAVHNPSGAAFGGLWRAEGFKTPEAALEALARHLTGEPDPGRRLDTIRRPAREADGR
jgi:hypothetical protein